MKNRLFWIGAFAYFIGDLITTYIGLSLGITETHLFIKTLPFMFMAKAGALIFMFGVFKYIEYLSITTKNEKTGENLKKLIYGELVVLGVGIGILNNILIIRGYL